MCLHRADGPSVGGRVRGSGHTCGLGGARNTADTGRVCVGSAGLAPISQQPLGARTSPHPSFHGPGAGAGVCASEQMCRGEGWTYLRMSDSRQDAPVLGDGLPVTSLKHKNDKEQRRKSLLLNGAVYLCVIDATARIYKTNYCKLLLLQ